MPYIKQERREIYDQEIDLLVDNVIDSEEDGSISRAGDFTYIVYRLAKSLFTGSYFRRALGMGCLLCCILELYRKSHAPYEDEKIKENGDVD